MPKHHAKKILFVCHKNSIYGNQTYTKRSSGLFNSTAFIVKALNAAGGFNAEIVEVNDNNDIDREVHKFKPDLCVIEALWVVPEKFPVLMKLHPKVKWYIHLHSDMPFLACEGMAMDWVIKSADLGVGIIANSDESFEALSPIVHSSKLWLLHNVYLGKPRPVVLPDPYKTHIDIGCFGAVRPLKNHLLQFLAAIQFARDMGKPLRFHLNVARIETGGAPVLKNMRQLADNTPDAELIEHRWFEPDDFIEHLHRKVDLGMQVSLTETFNVVSADYVTAGLPIVVSKEVKWCSNYSHAIDNSLPDIVAKMHRAWRCVLLVKWNQKLLKKFSAESVKEWVGFARAQ